MLPMILGFLGSAFAPALGAATGIAALANPLVASAIGSGVGTAIETGDARKGLLGGLGSFLGGSLTGKLFGGTAMGGGPSAANLAQAQAAGLPAAAAMAPPMRPENLGRSTGLFGSGGLGPNLRSGMDFMQSPTGIGSTLGGSLATGLADSLLPQSGTSAGTGGASEAAKKEMVPIPRSVRTPPTNYRGGISPEFDYGISTPYSYEDVLAYRDRGVLPYAEGGKTEIEIDDETGEMETETKRPVAGNEKTEIVDAIMAIKGQHPQPEVALGKFLAKYGESALRDLVDSVQSGEFDETVSRFASGEKGMVRGPGDGSGKDDKVPATIDGGPDVLLTEGEFVLRKDATDALEKKYGGGFLSSVNNAGKKAPEVLKSKVGA